MNHDPRTEPRVPAAREDIAWTPQLYWLTQAIEAQPDAPVNYLLRGEEWLVSGDLQRARDDFLRARSKAQRLLDSSAWGYLYQAYIDRALQGLRQCTEL